MKTILSIQSHVAFGYVGNTAAVPTLQTMGFNVIPIHTVQFSNHTGYGDWEGQVFTADHIREVLKGIERRIPLDQIDGFLTGYMGNADIGQVALDVANRLPEKAIWLCDPVMGDTDRGMFVRDAAIPPFFKQNALPAAEIITPNQFELEYLTGKTISTLNDAREACRIAHGMGPKIILLTSLIHGDTKDTEIQMIASHQDGRQYLVTTPRLDITPAPNGAGDCTSALFLAHNLNGENLEDSLGKTAASIFALFEKTLKAGTRELAIIESRDYFLQPPMNLRPIMKLSD